MCRRVENAFEGDLHAVAVALLARNLIGFSVRHQAFTPSLPITLTNGTVMGLSFVCMMPILVVGERQNRQDDTGFYSGDRVN